MLSELRSDGGNVFSIVCLLVFSCKCLPSIELFDTSSENLQDIMQYAMVKSSDGFDNGCVLEPLTL